MEILLFLLWVVLASVLILVTIVIGIGGILLFYLVPLSLFVFGFEGTFNLISSSLDHVSNWFSERRVVHEERLEAKQIARAEVRKLKKGIA